MYAYLPTALSGDVKLDFGALRQSRAKGSLIVAIEGFRGAERVAD
jgi:hypothetical protein